MQLHDRMQLSDQSRSSVASCGDGATAAAAAAAAASSSKQQQRRQRQSRSTAGVGEGQRGTAHCGPYLNRFSVYNMAHTLAVKGGVERESVEPLDGFFRTLSAPLQVCTEKEPHYCELFYCFIC
jgi:hypothetical protein